jgi:CHAD domain-containing protein
MYSEQGRTQKLFDSLLRVPGKISRTASPRVVHQLRTTIRRVETLLAVQPADTNVETKLLKQLARLRRRAGKVRDLDVQIAALRGVRLESTAKDKERVMRALNKAHAKRIKKLVNAVEKAQDRGLRKHLKRARTEVLQQAKAPTDAAREEAKLRAASLVQSALDEFAAMVQARRSAVTENTLHEFRTACKSVRYKAEIAGNSDRAQAAVAQLKLIQDAAGEWHDWLTLTQTAEKVLARSTSSPLVAALRVGTRSKLLQAQRTTTEAQRALLAMRRTTDRRKEPTASRRNVAQSASALAG